MMANAWQWLVITEYLLQSTAVTSARKVQKIIDSSVR